MEIAKNKGRNTEMSMEEIMTAPDRWRGYRNHYYWMEGMRVIDGGIGRIHIVHSKHINSNTIFFTRIFNRLTNGNK